MELPLNDPGLYFYYFDLYTDFRRIYRGPDNCGVVSWQEGEKWQITVYDAGFQTPECIKGKVFYQIFPDRFCEGIENKPMPFPDRLYQADKHAEPFWQPNETGGHLNEDYFGGDLEGIRIKLPYLREMGVDYLYLNPIFEAHSNHRYNTADYLNVDPLLGTNEEFEVLCREAAKYGIGIVLDGVFSHTGSDSRYFNREGRYGDGGAYRDPNSPYRSWYDFDSGYPCGYRSWWGFETLPEVNEENPSYVEFITGEGGVIDTWLRRGAAGFRLDVADELPDDFIEKIRAAVKRVSPEKFLLGEVWEDATTKYGFGQRRTYLLGKGLDSVMNYPLRDALIAFLIGAEGCGGRRQGAFLAGAELSQAVPLRADEPDGQPRQAAHPQRAGRKRRQRYSPQPARGSPPLSGGAHDRRAARTTDAAVYVQRAGHAVHLLRRRGGRGRLRRSVLPPYLSVGARGSGYAGALQSHGRHAKRPPRAENRRMCVYRALLGCAGRDPQKRKREGCVRQKG